VKACACPLALVALLLAWTPAGCDREDVHSYRVPKSSERPSGIGAMLAGAGGGGANPSLPPRSQAPAVSWSLPGSWKEVPTTQQFRLATFDAGGVEVSVTAFPGAAGGVLANVNRWRGQIGLDPTDDAGLGALLATTREGASEVSLLSMNGKDGKVMLGAIIDPGDGQTWFVKATTDAAKAEGLRAEFAAFAKSFRLAASAATSSSGAPAAETVPMAAAAGIDARLAHYAPPAGWAKESTGGNIVAAAFNAANSAGGARVTATSLGNDGGGDLANINRWRGQLGLVPLPSLSQVERSDLVEGLLAVDLRNADGTDRMISVIAPSGGSTWFFKLRGTAAGVEAERVNFAAFVREVAQGAKP
jgi:hypothetical protein